MTVIDINHNKLLYYRDNVEWNAEHEEEALKKIKENSYVKLECDAQG